MIAQHSFYSELSIIEPRFYEKNHFNENCLFINKTMLSDHTKTCKMNCECKEDNTCENKSKTCEKNKNMCTKMR